MSTLRHIYASVRRTSVSHVTTFWGVSVSAVLLMAACCDHAGVPVAIASPGLLHTALHIRLERKANHSLCRTRSAALHKMQRMQLQPLMIRSPSQVSTAACLLAIPACSD